jgi:5-formyltetrahydrofolate cyclo-ligase
MNLRTKSFKRSLRTYFKSKRKDIEAREWEWANEAIRHHLFRWDVFKHAHTVHSYISIAKHREVDTLEIINYCLTQGKKAVVPIMEQNRQLRHSYLMDINDTQENDWGVIEPISELKADLNVLDLVLVPLLAIDKEGTRLGYGAGFYDSFLTKIPSSVPKIGLLLEGFSVYSLPKDVWDVPLDGYISEKGIHLL